MNTTEVTDDIISCTPAENKGETSQKIIRTTPAFNKKSLTNLVYYPGELSRPKHPKAFKPVRLESDQTDIYFLRLICEIKSLKNVKFRYGNVRTVGTYNIFKNLDHIKDCVTGHRIELDFSNQFYNNKPQLRSSLMILGTIKHKSFVKDNETVYVPYIIVKTWEEWSGKINFHEFYYNAQRFRSPQIDETIPIEEPDAFSDDMSSDEDFETTAFFAKLKSEGLLNDCTEQLVDSGILNGNGNECIDTSTEKLFDDSDIIM